MPCVQSGLINNRPTFFQQVNTWFWQFYQNVITGQKNLMTNHVYYLVTRHSENATLKKNAQLSKLKMQSVFLISNFFSFHKELKLIFTKFMTIKIWLKDPNIEHYANIFVSTD